MNVWQEGGTVTLLGLLVVFTCLVLIILIISLMSSIMRERKKPEPKAEKKFEAEMHKPLPEIPVVDVQQDELLAVLTAAAAAFMDDEDKKQGLVVRSYRRISPDSAWARAGRTAQIFNKF